MEEERLEQERLEQERQEQERQEQEMLKQEKLEQEKQAQIEPAQLAQVEQALPERSQPEQGILEQERLEQEKLGVRKRDTQLDMWKLIDDPLYHNRVPPSDGDNQEDGADSGQTQNQVTNTVGRVQEGQGPAQKLQAPDTHSAKISRLDANETIPGSPTAASLNDVRLDDNKVCIDSNFGKMAFGKTCHLL